MISWGATDMNLGIFGPKTKLTKFLRNFLILKNSRGQHMNIKLSTYWPFAIQAKLI